MLEKEIVENINIYLKGKNILYSNELRMGIGIPDISFSMNVDKKLKPLNDYYLIKIFSYIEQHERVTINQIQENFLFPIRKIKNYLLELVSLKLIKIFKDYIKAIKSICNKNLGTIVSIEAKIKDWKGACLQAQRYLYFSDYSYVAMPSIFIKNVDIRKFEKNGIGLLSVKNDRIVEILDAKKSTTCDYIQKYIITSKIIENNKRNSIEKQNIFSKLTMV